MTRNGGHDHEDGFDPYDRDDEAYGEEGSGDGDASAERTFAALPPVAGRGFAESWWGRSWIKALEDTALDAQQLKKGRRHAREGAVGAVSVRPGRITAVVRDRDGTRHRVDVLIPELDDGDWHRFLDMAVDRAGHIAALLDREMPPHLVEDAATAGVELLPGMGDLEPECGCESWDLCPHAAALCYTVARLLDQDPFVLLLMRGRGERRLLDELQERSVARAAGGAPDAGGPASPGGAAAGVPAAEAFAARDILPPLPAPPPVPEEPGPPPCLDAETDPVPGAGPDALEFLAADAAVQAHRLLAEALSPGHRNRPAEPDPAFDEDAVRLAAAVPGPVISGRLAAATGRSRAGLDLAVRAWRTGGPVALRVLDDDWSPDAGELARAAAALEGAWEAADPRPKLRSAAPGRWTVVGADVQLRYGPDGRWWPYRKERSQWVPAGPADSDPEAALAGAGGETG
ncbi:SWF or SNF family helicase [Streptomyces qinzhouensis]|uniref:SWF or SNF family helicase n=1 Tax=Streptomyces qinzhouensis TaxID=2599401 RepID=A0A5B8IPG0_9ACTN|nr:SWF or SNF family helicase [Streptomyces qinzhouensis]QDY80528.1 SWF or SNF family helicase [Streptomyces qinzhouensis]